MRAELTPQIAAMYLGCEVDVANQPEQIPKVGVLSAVRSDGTCSLLFPRVKGLGITIHAKDATLILRRLQNITEDEAKALYLIRYPNEAPPANTLHDWWNEFDEFYIPQRIISCGRPEIWLHLLSKHFDLFGLIDAGLAVEKTNSIP